VGSALTDRQVNRHTTDGGEAGGEQAQPIVGWASIGAHAQDNQVRAAFGSKSGDCAQDVAPGWKDNLDGGPARSECKGFQVPLSRRPLVGAVLHQNPEERDLPA